VNLGGHCNMHAFVGAKTG